MNLEFYKYHGTGNDFIMVNGFGNNTQPLTKNMIEQLCNRRFGIGADGLIILKPHLTLDFEMLYYNADGNVGSMCGNGGRCAVAFAKYFNIIKNSTSSFIAYDGEHKAILNNDDSISLLMNNVNQIQEYGKDFVLDTGSPHYVTFVSNIKEVHVYKEGKRIRNSTDFIGHGINVNFAQLSDNYIVVHTYERGVEDETFSCGTGVTAVALCASLRDKSKQHFNFDIVTLGGKLNVSFDKINSHSFSNIYLKGAAVQVYQGQYII